MTLQRVVAVATGKGGTGKSSVAANMAGLSAAAGWATLLIDMDPQGNLGEDLGYTWDDTGDDGRHLTEALMTGSGLQPVIKDVRKNLDVICGGQDLEDLEDFVVGRERRAAPGRTLLREALEPLVGDYDLVVIDTPPSRRSALVLLALTAARWIVIPTKADRSSIKGLRVLGQTLESVRAENPELAVLGAVLFDVGSTSTTIRTNASQDIHDSLGDIAPLFESVIRHSERAAVDAREKGRLSHELAETVHAAEPWWKALKEGRRPVHTGGSAPGLAEDYGLLTQEVLARIADSEEEAAS